MLFGIKLFLPLKVRESVALKLSFSLLETLPPRCCMVSLVRFGLIHGVSELRFTEGSKIENGNNCS